VRDHRDLLVWAKARDLTAASYRLTRSFPVEERFGVVAQSRRSAISVVSNIVEGAARRSDREFARHLDIALASASELEAQLDVAGMLEFAPRPSVEEVTQQVIEVKKMLSGLLTAVVQRIPPDGRAVG
jgi:four helix bundle protein